MSWGTPLQALDTDVPGLFIFDDCISRGTRKSKDRLTDSQRQNRCSRVEGVEEVERRETAEEHEKKTTDILLTTEGGEKMMA